MTPQHFEHLLSLVAPLISKTSQNFDLPSRELRDSRLPYVIWQQVIHSNPNHLTFGLVDQQCQVLYGRPAMQSGHNYMIRISKHPKLLKSGKEFLKNFPLCGISRIA